MKKRIASSILIGALIFGCVPALALETEADTIFSAMQEELARCKSRLKIAGHESPYFVSYSISENESAGQNAEFGALFQPRKSRSRVIDADVRIGSYDLDNTNLDQNFYSNFSWYGAQPVPLENDQYALRRALWLLTDTAYKKAVEDLEKKRAIIRAEVVSERAPDFSRETPTVHLEPIAKAEQMRPERSEMIRRLSAIFKNYPKIVSSSVSYDSESTTTWLANSEGFKVRRGEQQVKLTINARSQATDGMTMGDQTCFEVDYDAELPSYEKMAARVEAMAQRLTRWADAPLAEKYEGPVLFEKEAAAELLNSLLAVQLGTRKPKIVQDTYSSDEEPTLEDRLNRRILPRFVSLIDDASAMEFQGCKLRGGFTIDDQGIKPKKLTLVENGILKTLCSGRTPTKSVPNSNGHWRVNTAQPSILFLQTEQRTSLDEMKKRLIARGKEENLEHVYVIKSMAPNRNSLANPKKHSYYSEENASNSAQPLEAYRINVSNGKEEFVRIGGFGDVPVKVLKDLAATGNDTAPYLLDRNNWMHHLVTPSLLVSEIELTKGDTRRHKPPHLRHPYFEKAFDGK